MMYNQDNRKTVVTTNARRFRSLTSCINNHPPLQTKSSPSLEPATTLIDNQSNNSTSYSPLKQNHRIDINQKERDYQQYVNEEQTSQKKTLIEQILAEAKNTIEKRKKEQEKKSKEETKKSSEIIQKLKERRKSRHQQEYSQRHNLSQSILQGQSPTTLDLSSLHSNNPRNSIIIQRQVPHASSPLLYRSIEQNSGGNLQQAARDSEWAILQQVHEHKMKMREDIEKESQKIKKNVQRQWVLEQINERNIVKKLFNKNKRGSSILIESPSQNLPVIQQQQQQQQQQLQLQQQGPAIDDKFFQKFSYEETLRHDRWRRAQLQTISHEYKEQIQNRKQQMLQLVNSESLLPLNTSDQIKLENVQKTSIKQLQLLKSKKNNNFLDVLIDRNQKEAISRNQSLCNQRERNLTNLEHWSEQDKQSQFDLSSVKLSSSNLLTNPEEKHIYTNNFYNINKISHKLSLTPNTLNMSQINPNISQVDQLKIRRKLQSIRLKNIMSEDERAINKTLIIEAHNLLGVKL